MYTASWKAGVSPDGKLILGLASFMFNDGKYGLFPFVYNHMTLLSFGTRLTGDGAIGETNSAGTVSNCSSVTVLILGNYNK